MIWKILGDNLNYTVAVILFCLGLYTLIVPKNLVRKIIGLNIMESAVFLFIVCTGYLEGGTAPIVHEGVDASSMVSPLPQALVLTGIVVAVSTTALALFLVMKLHSQYGTVEEDDMGEVELQ